MGRGTIHLERTCAIFEGMGPAFHFPWFMHIGPIGIERFVYYSANSEPRFITVPYRAIVSRRRSRRRLEHIIKYRTPDQQERNILFKELARHQNASFAQHFEEFCVAHGMV